MKTASTLLLGDSNLFPVGEFSDFNPNKKKSSNITLLPREAILCKVKPRRNPINSLREFVALHVWERVLSHHTAADDIKIGSPQPIGIDDQYQIFMNFVAGVTGDQTLSGAFRPFGMSRLESRMGRLDFITRMGKLLRLKEVEGLQHSDFLLRHVLYDLVPSHSETPKLNVIDVENTSIVDDVAGENARMKSFMRNGFSFPGDVDRKKVLFENAFSRGFDAPIDEYSVVRDILSDIKKELGPIVQDVEL